MDKFSAVSPGYLRIISVLLVISMPQVALAIDMESATNGPCFEVKNTTALDLNWVNSVKQWYYPFMCRSDLYHTARGILKVDPMDIPESDLYYKSCITWEFDDKCATVTGFGGKRLEVRSKCSSGFKKMDFMPMNSNNIVASCYTTLTDNKTFFVQACCFGDKMTWGASSPFQVLPKRTIRKITKHAEDLGFHKEQFTGLRYDTC